MQSISLLTECKQQAHTILQKLRVATQYLEQQSVEEAKENAELLLLYVLGLDRSKLFLSWHEPFPKESIKEFVTLLERKGNGEPIQYITGEAWFYSERFEVNRAVLIPRPETELLVEAVLTESERYGLQPLTVLDVGTGSGAISITLQKKRSDWHVIASDLSPDALAQAQHNASLHGVKDKMSWVEGDLLAPFVTSDSLSWQGKFIDILVSNPPYIPQADMEGLQREVKDYEPHLALVGGVDGLDPYRQMINVLASLNNKPAIVAFELGIHQPQLVKAMLEQIGAWDKVSIITDYNGIERHVIAIKVNDKK